MKTTMLPNKKNRATSTLRVANAVTHFRPVQRIHAIAFNIRKKSAGSRKVQPNVNDVNHLGLQCSISVQPEDGTLVVGGQWMRLSE